jgi:hypothetical protein
MADNERSKLQEWQCPPAAVKESDRIGWINEACEEGQKWLKAQRGYSDHQKALDILSGIDRSRPTAEYRSRMSTNRLKRNAREITGTLAKLRPMWGYHSDNSAYKPQAEMMNKVTRAWYLESFADRAVKEGLDYAAATCRGWLRPIYRRDMYGTGRGEIKLLTYGSPCVLPTQLPASGDWQSAYAMTYLDEFPVAMAHGMFPMFQHRLRPTYSRFWYMNDSVRQSAKGNILQRMFKRAPRTPGAEELSDLLVPVRYTYVIDLSINTTDKEIPMGEPGASWSYTVPFKGQRISTGLDPQTQQPTWREANEDDARLYPQRRLIISSEDCIMYDGPSFDWHGMFPGISFCLDEWPWEPLGFALTHDGYDIQTAINEINRGDMDKVRAQLRPSFAYDSNSVSAMEAKRFDPFMPDARLGFDGTNSENPPFQQAMTPEALKITPESRQFVSYLEQTLDDQQAVRDVMAFAKLRAVGSMDELEKIMEATGPIVESLSRSMEPPMRDLGVMVKYLVLQFYTTPRIMQFVGIEGTAPEVFDYDPASIVPSHLVGENPEKDSPTSRIQRARIFADNLRFFILPNSLHEMTQMVMKLGLIQLRKAGVMIDSQTIAEAWNVPNYGTIEGSTVMERWQREQEMQLEFAARMKELAGGVGAGQPPGGAAPGKTPEGRPPSGGAPPALKQKEGGARSTITESK